VLAALLKCPLYAMACVREADANGRSGYVLRMQCLAEQVVLPRRARHEAMTAHAQQFADWLEVLLSRAPLAWFNFFPFWRQGAVLPSPEQHDPNHEH
jgi:predicted LPLAT superfamily acyltransferase